MTTIIQIVLNANFAAAWISSDLKLSFIQRFIGNQIVCNKVSVN